MELLDNMAELLKTPFVGDLDLGHLFLLVGVVLIFVAVWGLILNHVKMAAVEVTT